MTGVKRAAVLFLTLILVLAIAGCGSSAQPADSGKSEETGTSAGTSETAADTTESEKVTAEAEAPSKEGTQEAEPVEESSENTSQEPAEEPNENTANAGSDVLVVYFSRTGEQYGVGVIDEGNTAVVAKMIAESTGADVFEIMPLDDYYPMTYNELTDVAKREQNENARPAYAGEVPDLSAYSTVFIGAPVWWGDWPMICYTFFENEDLSGKTLYPFSTHAGSGLSGFDQKLASAVPDSTVGEGLAITGEDCQNDRDSVRNRVTDWLSGLGY